MKSPEVKENFIRLRAEGHSFSAISEMLDVSKPTLQTWAKEFSSTIEALTVAKTEFLLKEFTTVKEARLRLLGEQIERVRDELANRDLSEVSTDKLYVVLLKLCELHGKEMDSLSLALDGSLNTKFRKISA